MWLCCRISGPRRYVQLFQEDGVKMISGISNFIIYSKPCVVWFLMKQKLWAFSLEEILLSLLAPSSWIQQSKESVPAWLELRYQDTANEVAFHSSSLNIEGRFTKVWQQNIRSQLDAAEPSGSEAEIRTRWQWSILSSEFSLSSLFWSWNRNVFYMVFIEPKALLKVRTIKRAISCFLELWFCD